jgi:protein TonB
MSSADGPAGTGAGGAATPDRGGGDGDPFAPTPEHLVRAMPEVAEEVRVPYTDAARRAGIEGTVRLVVDVDEEGRVHRARPRGALLGYGLDEAAAQALSRFRFRPARDHADRAVPVRILYSYTFRLRD